MKPEVSAQSQDQPPRTLCARQCTAPVAPPKGAGPNTGGSALTHDRPDPGAARPSSPRRPARGAPAQALVIPTGQFRRAPPTLFPPPPKRAQVQ